MIVFFFLMIRRPPRSTRTDTLLPYTTLFRSVFSGWLFKNSPSLNVVEHAIYDVWVKDCRMSFPNEEAPVSEGRSEEHTSELQSLMRISYAVFCLKKKTHNKIQTTLENKIHQVNIYIYKQVNTTSISNSL